MKFVWSERRASEIVLWKVEIIYFFSAGCTIDELLLLLRHSFMFSENSWLLFYPPYTFRILSLLLSSHSLSFMFITSAFSHSFHSFWLHKKKTFRSVLKCVHCLIILKKHELNLRKTFNLEWFHTLLLLLLLSQKRWGRWYFPDNFSSSLHTRKRENERDVSCRSLVQVVLILPFKMSPHPRSLLTLLIKPIWERFYVHLQPHLTLGRRKDDGKLSKFM